MCFALKMKGLFSLFVIAAISKIAFGSDEILSILNGAEDLTLSEISALKPLFQELQKQYDFIVSQKMKNDGQGYKPKLIETGIDLDQDIESYWPHLYEVAQIDARLPSMKDLLGDINPLQMSEEDQLEFQDLKDILEEALEESQTSLNEIIHRSLQIEGALLKINKPKIVMYIYNALGVLYDIAGRAGRAAYCTYFYTPELNESLHNVYSGVDCYTYTTSLILEVQHQTVYTVKTIKKNVFNLAEVYKKIIGKNSLLGKILTGILNIQKILKNVQESYTVAMKALDNVENHLPEAAKQSVNCGTDFAKTIPQIAQTVSLLSECILLVDDSDADYEFLKSENERGF